MLCGGAAFSVSGTPLAGHIEDLLRLREICTDYEMWLHVQGSVCYHHSVIVCATFITHTHTLSLSQTHYTVMLCPLCAFQLKKPKYRSATGGKNLCCTAVCIYMYIIYCIYNVHMYTYMYMYMYTNAQDMYMYMYIFLCVCVCLQIAREADSLTLCPGTWFGLLSSPWVVSPPTYIPNMYMYNVHLPHTDSHCILL